MAFWSGSSFRSWKLVVGASDFIFWNRFKYDVIESTFNSNKLICFMDDFVAQTIKKRLWNLIIRLYIDIKNSRLKFRSEKSKMYIFASYLPIHRNWIWLKYSGEGSNINGWVLMQSTVFRISKNDCLMSYKI